LSHGERRRVALIGNGPELRARGKSEGWTDRRENDKKRISKEEDAGGIFNGIIKTVIAKLGGKFGGGVGFVGGEKGFIT